MPAFTLRPATEDDVDLAYEITQDAMRGYVEQTWGHWDPVDQQHRHRHAYVPANDRMILIDGIAVGLLCIQIHPTHLWLSKLYLRSGAQGQGVGTAVLQMVISEANILHLPIHLRVLRVNTRARALYGRHGFLVTDEPPEHFVMQRAADSP